MTFYHATLETTNFRFDAYGITETDARKALRHAWRIHKSQYRATDTWADVEPDTRVRKVNSGESWRDGERLYPAGDYL